MNYLPLDNEGMVNKDFYQKVKLLYEEDFLHVNVLDIKDSQLSKFVRNYERNSGVKIELQEILAMVKIYLLMIQKNAST